MQHSSTVQQNQLVYEERKVEKINSQYAIKSDDIGCTFTDLFTGFCNYYVHVRSKEFLGNSDFLLFLHKSSRLGPRHFKPGINN